jgi:chromosome segregation ATPase
MEETKQPAENQFVIEKLQQQNKKLRNELKMLSRQLDEALDKKKQTETVKARGKPNPEPQDEAAVA